MTQDAAQKVDESTSEKLRTLKFIKDYKQILQIEKKKKELQNQLWEHRRKQKLQQSKKPNIVFVCSRAATWGSLQPVCEAFFDDTRCNVKVVAIPEKLPQLEVNLAHEKYTDIGAYDLIKRSVKCRVIDGYDSFNRKWLDLRKLEPDYLFMQTPYNGHRPEQYDSSIISTYSKLCVLPYAPATFCIDGDMARVSHPADFMQDVSFSFTVTEEYHAFITNYFANLFTPYCKPTITLVGEPRFDSIRKLAGQEVESPVWKHPRSSNRLRAIWTPRWTTSGGHSHFIAYKEKFLELCDMRQDLDFCARPHPLTLPNAVASYIMTPKQVEEYKAKHAASPNATLDERGEYYDSFVSSDVLITDLSSIFHDYAATGKPIIYCHGNDQFNETSRKLAEGFYWAHSWADVVKYIDMLARGEDPLVETRMRLIDEIYKIPEEGVGTKVKNTILDHFFAG